MRLFDDATLRTLERLSLWAESVRVGVMKGDRRSRRRGTSIEFADYRDYTQGDDLRRLDWNVLARLERPFIKLTEEEEDLAVHLLIDTSDSMNWPPGALGVAAQGRAEGRLAGRTPRVAGDEVRFEKLEQRPAVLPTAKRPPSALPGSVEQRYVDQIT